MKFLDTNIFLRAILNDHSAFSVACRTLFRDIEQNKIEAMTTDLVVAEVVFVLQKNAQVTLSKSDIYNLLSPLLSLPYLSTRSKRLWNEIFTLFIEKNIDFIDAYNMITMRAEGITTAYSYDHDFDKAKIVKRQEP